MTKIVNLLTDNSYSFFTSAGGWSLAAPNTNGSISVSGERKKYSDLNAIKIVPSKTGPVSLRISGIAVPQELSFSQFRGAVWIAAEDDVTAKVTIYTTTSLGNSSSVAETKIHGVHSNRWTLASVSQSGRTIETGQPATLTMDITFHNVGNPSSLTSDYIYITSPILSPFDYIYLDYATAETYFRLPEYMLTADTQQENPVLPLYRFLNVALVAASDISRLWWHYAYFPPFDVEEQKNSGLVDPYLANYDTLIWLSRILGIKIQSPPTGFTSWAAMEAALDTDSSGTATWTEWEAPGDWASLEDEDPDVNNFEDELRWQVATAIYGINAGTSNALKIAAQRVLTGTKQVTVVPRHTGDPWHILVQTLTSETPDASVIPDLLAGATPAGFQVTHQTV